MPNNLLPLDKVHNNLKAAYTVNIVKNTYSVDVQCILQRGTISYLYIILILVASLR